jgi:hypothetical protein
MRGLVEALQVALTVEAEEQHRQREREQERAQYGRSTPKNAAAAGWVSPTVQRWQTEQQQTEQQQTEQQQAHTGGTAAVALHEVRLSTGQNREGGRETALKPSEVGFCC